MNQKSTAADEWFLGVALWYHLNQAAAYVRSPVLERKRYYLYEGDREVALSPSFEICEYIEE